MIKTDTMYDWEKEARFAEIRTEEMFGPEARKPFHVVKDGPDTPTTIIQVRSLYSPDWTENHEA
jgi:hypothetical protein